MPVLPYDTHASPARQPSPPFVGDEFLGDEWAREVVPRLPANIEQQARALGALQRRRGLRNATDLLRALLSYALCTPSFRQLGAWAVLLELADLSEAAWRKRLRCAHRWLGWLVGELLSATPAAATPAAATPAAATPAAATPAAATPAAATPAAVDRANARRILLVDATALGQPGGAGDEWRLHTAYNLLARRLSHVTIGDRHSGEHLGHYQLLPGDIVVADNCYGYRRSVALAHNCQAYVVLRINLSSFPLETEQGLPFDIAAWLHSGKGRYTRRGQMVYCRYKGQRYGVRVLALRLPPQQARKALQRKRRCAQKHGYTPSPQSLAVAGWVVLVTTLPQQEWSDEQVLRLYRARWQIELVFKRMKQLLSLGDVRLKERVGVEAVICLKLIGWALQEAEVSVIREVLEQLQSDNPLEGEGVGGVCGLWLPTRLCVQMLCQQIVGAGLGCWSMGWLKQCVPKLRRYLCGSARQRVHQETDIHGWLSKHFRHLTLTSLPQPAIVPSTLEVAA